MSISVKRIISFLLVITLVFSIPVIGFAKTNNEENTETNNAKYTTINSTAATIVKSGITVTCSATLQAKYSTSLKIVMVLQKSTSDGWTDVKTWTKTGTGTFLTTEESKVINILATYRLKVKFTAGSESVTTYSYY